MGKLRFISPCIEFATSVFSFFNKTKGNFIVIFSIAVKNQNSIFIKYIKKREISWKVFIFQSTKRFLFSYHERRALLGRCSNETRVLRQFLSEEENIISRK